MFVIVIGNPINGNFLRLSAESLSMSNVDDEVLEWNDATWFARDVSNKDCGKPIYGKASWNPSIPVVKFGHSGQSCLRTKYEYPVSTSGTYVAVVYWTGNGGDWDVIAAVSQDKYWSIRFYSNSRELIMQVRNEHQARVAIELNKPYIIVGRVDDDNKKIYMWIWDIKEMKWNKKTHNSQGIPSGQNEVIILGRSIYHSSQWFQGEIAEYSMWDRLLSDSEVDDLVEQYLTISELRGKNFNP